MCCLRIMYDYTYIIKEIYYEMFQDETIHNCKLEETDKLIDDSIESDIDEGFELV